MIKPDRLTLVSYLAPNWFWFYEAVALSLSRRLQLDTQILEGQSDPLTDPSLLQGQLDLAFICGLPFIRHHWRSPHQLEALVAPVMQAPRYQNQPVYFADVIVSATSNLYTIAELAGKTFCYNDPGSNSGYHLLRHHLMQAGYPSPFFGNAIQSGSHQRSMQWIAEGRADCAAIDSTVFEQELIRCPDLEPQLRVIGSIGPCPMPPIVVAHHLDSRLIEQIQQVLLEPDPRLQTAMRQAGVQRYAPVQSEVYEPIGRFYEATRKVGYELSLERASR